MHGARRELPPAGPPHVLIVVVPEVQSAVTLSALVEFDEIPPAAGPVSCHFYHPAGHDLPDPVVLRDGRAPQLQCLGAAGGDAAPAEVRAACVGLYLADRITKGERPREDGNPGREATVYGPKAPAS